jgi:hypothetical protein
MGDAAPQAAEGMSAEEIEKALNVLRLVYRDEYMFGHDPEHGWWVIRKGDLSSLLTADSPGELGKMLEDEYGTRQS